MAGEAIAVFFSYSREDEPLRDKLAEHLSILKRQGVIAEWSDRQISAGSEWATEIDAHLNSADIILLLISASFLNSEYCWGVELKRAMERHEAGEACVIPIILRPVDWKGAPFSQLQAYPKNARPVTLWQNQDEAFVDIVQGIRAAAEERIGITGAQSKEAHYRQEIKHCLQEGGGEISPLNRTFLDRFRNILDLSAERAAAIEQEVLKSYQTYRETFTEFLKQQHPFTRATQNRLKRLQQMLMLNDEEVEAIESRLIADATTGFEDDLTSEKGVNYTKLRDLLKAQKWKEADYETYLVMLQAVGREEGDWIRDDEFQTFPCKDLCTIDRLWVRYSGGRFGFSVQKNIYVEIGGNLDGEYDKKIWKKFGVCVGWRVESDWVSYKDLVFGLAAPVAQLPCLLSGWDFRRHSSRSSLLLFLNVMSGPTGWLSPADGVFHLGTLWGLGLAYLLPRVNDCASRW